MALNKEKLAFKILLLLGLILFLITLCGCKKEPADREFENNKLTCQIVVPETL